VKTSIFPSSTTMQHYTNAIRTLGSADGYNTEFSEWLHIDYAKEGYQASNKRDYVEQMALWLQRQEAIDFHAAYLDWTAQTKLNPFCFQQMEILKMMLNHLKSRMTKASILMMTGLCITSPKHCPHPHVFCCSLRSRFWCHQFPSSTYSILDQEDTPAYFHSARRNGSL